MQMKLVDKFYNDLQDTMDEQEQEQEEEDIDEDSSLESESDLETGM